MKRLPNLSGLQLDIGVKKDHERLTNTFGSFESILGTQIFLFELKRAPNSETVAHDTGTASCFGY